MVLGGEGDGIDGVVRGAVVGVIAPGLCSSWSVAAGSGTGLGICGSVEGGGAGSTVGLLGVGSQRPDSPVAESVGVGPSSARPPAAGPLDVDS